MENQELLAAIGKVVVDSAELEYAIAVLVSMTEGRRDQDCEDHAVGIVKKTGEAMRQLDRLAREHPERSDLKLALHDARSVLDDRHVIAHSLALEEIEVDGQAALVIFHPSSGRETQITAAQVLDHAHDIRIAYRRVHKLIAAASEE